jgi:PIN domain nuclease of toxin-antitoxin system
MRASPIPASVLDAMKANAFDPLAISATHALAAGELPAHHGDPFDRMLIAQARMEKSDSHHRR